MKFKKIIFIFLVLLFFYIWKDYKKIDFSYLNQNKITYSYNNLNNNILKKIHNFIEINYQNFLVRNFDRHQNHWTIESSESRDELKKYIYLEQEKKFTSSKINQVNIDKNWYRSHGNNTSNRFSSLHKINVTNIAQLELAWIYEDKEGKNDIQANPIVVNGIIYTPSSSGRIVSINGETGKEIWRSKEFGYFVARRGLIFWQSKNKNIESRLYFSNRERLICLNPKTGKLVKSFGGNGQVRTGLNVMTPVIFKENIVIATWDHAIEVYDLITGKIKWKLKYKKNINQRVGGKKYSNTGYNPWGGISLDEERGILFITTGNPHAYFDGTLRPGKNEGSNSIIAISLTNRKVIWSFQETSHDIWNSDLPAPPILTSLNIKNKKVDVVLTPTKRSNTIILDRLSGKPIFEYRLRKTNSSNIPGEKTSLYQPDLTVPQPFGKNIFTENDFWSYDEKKFNKIKSDFKDFKYGFYEPYELGESNLQYNFNGGAEWMGASVDHKKNIMYVTANNIPWVTSVEKVNQEEANTIPEFYSIFRRAQDEKGYPISKPPWGTITAIDLNRGKIIWQIPFGEYEELKLLGIPKTGTENFGGVTGTEGDLLFATGTLDKRFYVFNSITGEELYSYEMPYIGSAPPSTYLYKNKQYVIVHSTGGSTLMQGYPDLVENGNKLIAFKLKE